MRIAKLSNMDRGWFVGAFVPSAFATDACEVALKSYKAGYREAKHFHKIATEVTLIVSGRILMLDCEFGPGDIIVVEPGDAVDFVAITDAVNVVVKVPGALDDKYIGLQDV
jgi:quercetin dioxygenase-like cupin family protein